MNLKVDSKKAFQEVPDNYERERWHKNPIRRAAYKMTKDAITRRLLRYKKQARNILEVGPGPGTWTMVLYDAYKKYEPHFDLVDISAAMLRQAKETLRDHENITTTESGFLEYEEKANHYDLFFSSRAIEYIEDKDKMISKIMNLLKKGGTGFIITKTPHYLREKLLGRDVGAIHTGQISPKDFKELLKKHGAKNIRTYPVVTNIPLLKSATINLLKHFSFKFLPLNPLSQTVSESYCIRFEK